ncbi:MAG TPA: nuclear transport factor 2 family protein [Pyrinomonadaceae bacterium]|jgi:ketosteroid isomerase-like protein|nr:nuclear transport factor 2 family protein [Pyrinomonadaceae bacterium]
MKRSALALLAGLVVVAVFTGCQPAADTNRNLAAVSASPVKETFDPAAIEAELIRIEREWANASKTHNAASVKSFLADNAVIIYPDGTTATKADEIRSIESGGISADSFEMLDPKVTVIDADSAFITGRSVIKNGKITVPNQKKPIDITGEYRFLDVYAKRDGKWQVLASQAVKVDPAAAAAATASPAASVPPPPAASPTAKTSPTP